MIALGLPLAWYIWNCEKQKKYSLVFLLFIPLAFIAVVLTASRTSFVAMIVGSFFLFAGISRLSLLNKISACVVVLISTVLAIKLVPSYSWDRLLTIGSQISAGDLGSRVNIWRGGIETFSQHPLIGTGIGTFRASVETYFGNQVSPHNLFLAIMVDMGLVGLFLFLGIMAAALYGVFQMPSMKKRLWIFVFLTWFVGVMALGWAHRKPTWFLIGLVAVQGAVQITSRENDASSVTASEI
ncbi:MAG: O-antigen ligase family protein [Syntrophotaleaceae bacterium]